MWAFPSKAHITFNGIGGSIHGVRTGYKFFASLRLFKLQEAAYGYAHFLLTISRHLYT